jgi:hypothetical protein
VCSEIFDLHFSYLLNLFFHICIIYLWFRETFIIGNFSCHPSTTFVSDQKLVSEFVMENKICCHVLLLWSLKKTWEDFMAPTFPLNFQNRIVEFCIMLCGSVGAYRFSHYTARSISSFYRRFGITSPSSGPQLFKHMCKLYIKSCTYNMSII